MSGFDNAEDVQVIQVDLTESQKANQESSLASYRSQVALIQTEIDTATNQLNSITDQIEQRKKDLADMFDRKRAEFDSYVSDFESKKKNIEGTLSDLDSQIAEKEHQRDTVLLSVAQRENESLIKQDELNSQAAIIAAAHDQLDSREQAITIREDDLANQIKEFKSYQEKRQAELDVLQQTLKNQADEVSSKKQDLISKLQELVSREAIMDVKEDESNTKLAAAQIIIEQAEEVNKQKTQNAIDAKANSDAALQNQTDATQIRVARIALNNQQQSITAREIAVSQAEKKIGG